MFSKLLRSSCARARAQRLKSPLRGRGTGGFGEPYWGQGTAWVPLSTSRRRRFEETHSLNRLSAVSQRWSEPCITEGVQTR